MLGGGGGDIGPWQSKNTFLLQLVLKTLSIHIFQIVRRVHMLPYTSKTINKKIQEGYNIHLYLMCVVLTIVESTKIVSKFHSLQSLMLTGFYLSTNSLK